MGSPFANSADLVPQPCIVFGTALEPFSLGHHLLFRKLRLPFADCPESKATADQLLIGIAVCAQPHGVALRSMLRGEWPRQFARWRKGIQSRLPWLPGRRKKYLQDAEAIFRNYLALGYESPPVWGHEVPGGVELSAPWEELIKVRLIRSGFSEDEVLNGYLPKLWYDYFTVCEFEQLSKITKADSWRKVFWTEKDSEAMKRRKARYERS